MIEQLPKKKLPRPAMLALELEEPLLAAPPYEPRSGDICPQCDAGKLDYDGMLNLACPKCGYAVGGCFT